MQDVIEVVRVPMNDEQNAQLQESFREFYKLYAAPKIQKELYVTKDSYTKFIRGKLRERTPYETDRNFNSYLSKDSKENFLVVYSKTHFNFPSGRTLTLTEHLTEPNGLTKSVEMSDSDGTNLTFQSYFHAESEVLARFLSEKGHLIGNT